MNTSLKNPRLLKFLGNYWNLRWLWITTTAVFGTIAIAYILLLKTDVWLASQGLIVRDEATGAEMRLGRFESQSAMKEAQETIVELAKNKQVLSDAVKTVSKQYPDWFPLINGEPRASDIEDLSDSCVAMHAPRGAALGTTEVIYIDVKAKSQDRALALNRAICDALENRLQEVREARANGVIQELTSAKTAAANQLAAATEKLQQIEAAVGSDLSDLRTLTENASSSSTTRLELDRIAKELQEAELELRQIESDLAMAKTSFENPDNLLQTPTKLVNSQPGLKRLREGLAAATISSSQLIAKYTLKHPLVIAARNTETQIREELRAELGVSIKTLSKDQELMTSRISQLKIQRSTLETRIAKLASVRAGYGNVVSEVSSRNLQLQEAEGDLTAAIAARDAALNSSLITRLDEPTIGEKPVGPGKLTILAGAVASGLFFGFGVVFLLSPLDANLNYGRRRQDYEAGNGRRANDRGTSGRTGPVERRSQTQPAASPTQAVQAPNSVAPNAGPSDTVASNPTVAPGTPREPSNPSNAGHPTKPVRPVDPTNGQLSATNKNSAVSVSETASESESANEAAKKAQSVIAAALEMSFSANENSAPIAPTAPEHPKG